VTERGTIGRHVDDVLPDALAAVDAEGFVHAGTVADPDLRYLTGTVDETRRLAFGYADGSTLLALSSEATAPAGFPGRVERVATGTDPVERLVSLLSDHCDDGPIAAPRQIPHDAACYVQNAGFELTSTTAVADARTVKTDPEVAAVARAADAAIAGMDRVRELLASATVVDGGLELDGDPVTIDRLRRAVDAAVVLAGGQPAGNTSVATAIAAEDTGTDAEGDADQGSGGSSTYLQRGEPIRIRLAPRDPAGYHAPLARTLTVDATGGWERRAHVACEAARRAGLDAAKPGESAAVVGEEVLAELGAYGFDPGRQAGPAGAGVGLSPRERPSLSESTELRAGMVLSLTPTLTDSAEPTIQLADTVVVTDDGARILTDCSTATTPEKY
jgi:Xaa-Pro aminopeptidase